MKKFSLICFLAFSVFLLSAQISFAAPFCACCAERGHYSITTSKPDQYAFDELKKLKFDSAQLYTDAGYPDTIKGIKPLGSSFTTTASLSGNLWRFVFKDDQAKSGTLNLAKPLSMTEYMVDQTPLADESSSQPVLYKEWRFKYSVNGGNGIFQSGTAPKTQYFLVLQGKGNVCTSAADFSSWRLEITGAKSSYAFLGKVSSE